VEAEVTPNLDKKHLLVAIDICQFLDQSASLIRLLSSKFKSVGEWIQRYIMKMSFIYLAQDLRAIFCIVLALNIIYFSLN